MYMKEDSMCASVDSDMPGKLRIGEDRKFEYPTCPRAVFRNRDL